MYRRRCEGRCRDVKSTTLNKNSKQTQKPPSYSKSSIDVVSQWRALARIDYSFYCEYVHRGTYKPAKHLEYVAEKLEKVESGDIKRLMIFMPPRHGKSMTVSETFPSYFIGKKPSRRVIEVSYGDSLARKFGRMNRTKVEEFGEELFDIKVSQENASMTNWGIKGRRGGMISAGIGGPITGEGADLLIIDDPIKNRQEADSQTYRNMVWNEWQNTLLTRLHPGGAIIIILTRWHEDDLAGRLLKEEPDKWEVINLAAVAEDENDQLGREIGETLWPEHGFDKKWAKEKKKEVGSRTWAALYQQRPSPAEGGILKRGWWQYYKVEYTQFDEIIQSWDMSFKDTKSAKGKDPDFVVGQVWGRRGADMYLLDQVRDRMDFPSTLQAVRNMTAKWPLARTKLVEDKANGPAVIASLKREIAGLIPVEPQGSKEARASAVSPYIEAGNVYLPDPTLAHWVNDFVEECAAFPNGNHDDQVDAMSQALLRLGGGRKKNLLDRYRQMNGR